MSIGNLILGVNSVTVWYLIHYGSLLQNPTDTITKYDSYFVIKCDKSLLQNASGYYYKMGQFYYKKATVTAKCDDFITKCDVYYKLCQYKLQSLSAK